MTFFSRRVTAALGVLSLLALGLLVLFGLVVSPPDVHQSDAVRLLYLHAPAAWLAYLAFGVTALCSLLYLWPRTRHERWDLLAGASAEIGVLFTGLTLFLGAVWAKPVWGVWWTWDARVTTTAVLFFVYLGYLALRRVAGDPTARAKRSAIAALIAFVDVPVVHFSVNWWRTLHQDATVFNPELKAKIGGSMALTLWIGVLAFTLLYAFLLSVRYRLAALDQGREERELDRAIAERLGQRGAPGDTVGVGA